MIETYISFYLRAYRIHIFVDTLRAIGSPQRICFMLSQDGRSLAVMPHEKRDFKSHRVAHTVYQGGHSLEISSYQLCSMLADLHAWDKTHSYRVPGRIVRGQGVVLFDLTKAKIVEKQLKVT